MRKTARERGMIVLIALHDLNKALRFADQTMVIGDGRVIACGRSSEVITVDLLRDVYRIEARPRALLTRSSAPDCGWQPWSDLGSLKPSSTASHCRNAAAPYASP
jgi:ABC-type hemin transport system ATPase subunit